MEKSRVLIVDDIEENLKVLTETLLQEGYAPLQAKNGLRAIEIAKKALPDLILLDIKMPGMDGYETIAELKKDRATQSIPVIFISALNQIDDKLKGFQSGAVDYVSKPFQKEEVLARVSTHLKLRQAQRIIEAANEKSESLLLNVLPQAVVEELKTKGNSDPQQFSNVTILFSDIIGFTSKTETMDAPTLIGQLNLMFTAFDEIMEKHGCERIKTIGDAYLAVCGMHDQRDDSTSPLVRAAQEMRNYLADNKNSELKHWEIRIGIHCGNLVGGIVGIQKYIYDIFGDAVNTASRMEMMAPPMGINLSEDAATKLSGEFILEEREPLEVKGKGPMKMFLLQDISS